MAKITASPLNAIITGLKAPNHPTNKKGEFGDLYIYDQRGIKQWSKNTQLLT